MGLTTGRLMVDGLLVEGCLMVVCWVTPDPEWTGATSVLCPHTFIGVIIRLIAK